MKIIFVPADTTGTNPNFESKLSAPSDDEIANNKYNRYSNWNLDLCFVDLGLFCVLAQQLLMRWDFLFRLFLSLLEHFLVILLKGFGLWHFYRCYWKFNYYEICYFKAKFYMQCDLYFISIKIIDIILKENLSKRQMFDALFNKYLIQIWIFYKVIDSFPFWKYLTYKFDQNC